MASNKKIEKKQKLDEGVNDDELNFDDLEGFDDFGSDLDIESIDERSREPEITGIAKEVAKGASKGFLDNIIRKTAEKALPEEYTSEFSTLQDYGDLIKENLEQNASKIKKSLYKLGKEVKKLLPFQLKVLDDFVAKYEEDYQTLREQSEEVMREASIASSLSSIFDKQLEITKAIEARKEANEEVDRRQSLISTKQQLNVLTSIDNNVAQQTAFTLQISKEYYRKSLELQFKSYFVQADMLKTMKEYYKGYAEQFDRIAKNTGLPDFVKLKNTEALQDVIRRSMFQTTFQSLFDNSRYVQGVKEKFARYLSQKTSDITDAIDQVTTIAEQINSSSDFEKPKIILGDLAGVFLGETLADKASKKLNKLIGNRLKENKYSQTGANVLSTLATSPASFFGNLKNYVDKKAEEYEDESTIGRSVKRKFFSIASDFLGITRPEAPDVTLEKESIMNLGEPALFDKKVHRSITEVIPMYLSKILYNVSNLKEMYAVTNKDKLYNFKERGELIYDFENKELTDVEILRSRLTKTYFAEKSEEGKLASSTKRLFSTVTSIAKNKDEETQKILNDKTNKKLFESYLKLASKRLGKEEFKYEDLINENSKAAKAIISEMAKSGVDTVRLNNFLRALREIKLEEVDRYTVAEINSVKKSYKGDIVKEFYNEVVSLHRGKKEKYNLKDHKADDIAKIISNYKLRGNAFTIDSIIDKKDSFILYAPPDIDLSKIKRELIFLIKTVESIMSSDDYVKKSQLAKIVAVVDKYIGESVTNPIEVFRAIQFAHGSSLLKIPENMRTYSLTVENVFEGRVGNSYMGIDLAEQTQANKNVLREILRTKGAQVRKIGEELARESIEDSTSTLEKWGSIYRNFRGKLNEAKNLKEVYNAYKEMIVGAWDQAKKDTARAYNESKKKLESFKGNMSKILDSALQEGGEAVKGKIVEQLNSYIKSLNETIEAERKALE